MSACAWRTRVIDRLDFPCSGGATAHYGKVVKPTSVLMVSLKTALINMDSLRRLRALAVREFNELAVLRKEDAPSSAYKNTSVSRPCASHLVPNVDREARPTFNGHPDVMCVRVARKTRRFLTRTPFLRR